MERKTLEQWAEADGVRLLDPDGFDRKDPNLFTRLFTREEWDQGKVFCTLASRNWK